MTVVPANWQDCMPARELLWHQPSDLGVHRVPSEIGHRRVEMGAQDRRQLVLFEEAQVDEHPSKHSAAALVNLEGVLELSFADEMFGEQSLTKQRRGRLRGPLTASPVLSHGRIVPERIPRENGNCPLTRVVCPGL